jgi:hypothetical protein
MPPDMKLEDAVHPVQTLDKTRKMPGRNALERRSWKKPYVILATNFYPRTRLLRESCSLRLDPLVYLGRHFTRTVHMLCDFETLLFNGILHMSSDESKYEYLAPV